MRYIFILMIFIISKANGQELWQLQPWANDSTYVIGAMASGEPQWIQINGVATKIDSVKYATDTLYIYTPDTTFKAEIVSGGGGVAGSGEANKVTFWKTSDTLTYDTALHYNPTTKILGVGTTSPTGTGSTVHVHGTTFSTIHLTNSTTGQTASDGSRIYTVADSLYIGNQENGRIDFGTNNAARMTITGAGRVGINNQNPQTTVDIGGEVTVSSLDTDGSAPTTSGTTRMVISDGTGKMSFTTIPTGTVTSVGLSTGTTGTDVNVSGSPVTSSGTITLNIPTASSSNRGALSSTDWSTFNGKLGSLNGLTASTQTFAVTNSTSGFTISSSGSAHTFNLPYEENSTSFRFGYQSLRRDNSVALGNNALGLSGSSATNNTAIGKDVLRLANSTGSGGTNNVGIGFQSLYSNTTGINNTCIANYSGYGLTSGSNNTLIGGSAALANSIGSDNTMIGYLSGRFNTGSSNIFIGSQAGYSETGSNYLYIEPSTGTPLIGGNFSSNLVGINTPVGSLARTLHVTGEMRVTDLVTDNPTFLVGADNDGDFARITPGTGLLLSGTTLNVSGVGTVTQVNTSNGITGGPITSTGTVQLTGQASALHNLGTNGIIARTGAGTVAGRTITAGDGITITNGDGVSGNPTVSRSQVASNLYRSTSLATFNTTSTAAKIDFNQTGFAINATPSSANDDITATVTSGAVFKVSCTCQFIATTAATYTWQFYRNGSTLGGLAYRKIAGAGEEFTVNFEELTSFTNGDVIDVRVDSSVNSNNNTIRHCVLNITSL